MKTLLLPIAVAALCACNRDGQPASQQKSDGYGGAAAHVRAPQGRVPDPKSPPQDRGSGGSGTVELRGDAALYYLYRHHLTNDGTGPQGRYFLSKDGRVFYKDAQDREHTVRPPSEGMRVSRSEAEAYKDIRGYQGQQNGRDLRGLASDDEKK